MLGHRGLSHSLFFAVALSALIALALRRLAPRTSFLALWGFLAACIASHGLLDALTNGGRGVAFFAPFSNERYFFPWQPIEVSPISVRRFFAGRGLSVLGSEALWIGAPSAGIATIRALATRRARDAARS